MVVWVQCSTVDLYWEQISNQVSLVLIILHFLYAKYAAQPIFSSFVDQQFVGGNWSSVQDVLDVVYPICGVLDLV